MVDLDLYAFARGVESELEKQGGNFSSLMDTHTSDENILPSFEGQRKWRYVQTPEGLRLSDGDRVYSFGLTGFGGDTLRVPRLSDPGLLDFEQGGIGKGTAQIHRSNPDSIYLTLANGRENPTFYLEHSYGKDWKYIPGKKLRKLLTQAEKGETEETPTVPVDPQSLILGAEKTAQLWNGLGGNEMNDYLWKGIEKGKDLLQGAGNHPLLTLGGLGIGALLIDRMRKRKNPNYAMESYRAPDKTRLNNVIAPTLLAGGALVGAGNMLR